MVRLVLIALFMMIVVCVGVYALWTIQVSQLKQDNLATDFKKQIVRYTGQMTAWKKMLPVLAHLNGTLFIYRKWN